MTPGTSLTPVWLALAALAAAAALVAYLTWDLIRALDEEEQQW